MHKVEIGGKLARAGRHGGCLGADGSTHTAPFIAIPCDYTAAVALIEPTACPINVEDATGAECGIWLSDEAGTGGSLFERQPDTKQK
jgi:hypothetical protein